MISGLCPNSEQSYDYPFQFKTVIFLYLTLRNDLSILYRIMHLHGNLQGNSFHLSPLSSCRDTRTFCATIYTRFPTSRDSMAFLKNIQSRQIGCHMALPRWRDEESSA